MLSRVRLFATPWTAAYQAPPSLGFSRQEYWSGVPLPSPIKPLQENISRILFGIKGSNVFLDPSPRAVEIKTHIKKWDLIKVKSFHKAKETINKMKRQPKDWEKVFANDVTVVVVQLLSPLFVTP